MNTSLAEMSRSRKRPELLSFTSHARPALLCVISARINAKDGSENDR